MPITQLNLDGPATKAELSRLEHAPTSAIEADVTKDGLEAEISTTKKGWRVAAFWKRAWSGEQSGGARLKRDL